MVLKLDDLNGQTSHVTKNHLKTNALAVRIFGAQYLVLILCTENPFRVPSDRCLEQ